MDSLILLRSIDIPLNWSSRSSRFLGEERREEERRRGKREERQRKGRGRKEDKENGEEGKKRNIEKKMKIKRQIMASIHHTPSEHRQTQTTQDISVYCYGSDQEHNGLIYMHSLSTQEDTHTLKTVVPS